MEQYLRHDAPVGIDDLNLYASTLSIDNAAIGRERGTSRYFDLVGIKRRSIAPPFEDAVTLAVNAARPLVEAAGRDAFELLIVATESGFDFGKPLSSYVHRHLGLGQRCRNLEVKHACYGGTASLQLATAWLRSGVARGKRALVVTTDLPGNQFGEPAEMTPGTGAVALSLAEEPRVLALDRAAGYAALEVYDTARPTATFHWVDEVLSLGAYLDLLEAAYAHYRAQVPGSLERDFDHVVYHMPVEMLVRKAHAALLEADDPDATADAAAASFERMVAPSLGYCSETGNIFSGTVYAGLAALVDSDPGPRAGARLGLYSYGSGSCGEFFSGTLQPDARAVVGAHGLRAHLAARRALTIPDYERIVREREAVAGVRAWAPDRALPEGHYAAAYDGRSRLVLDSVADFYRRYAWS
jgi:3-hydroxy-3-methylglutaryl CoA synthase